jgi:hypothetical protein
MEKVILIEKHLLNNLRKVVAEKIKGRFSEGEKIAIKMHMGEYGNLNYVRPPIAELIVDELKKIGAKPFVFDAPVLYLGSRDTVEKYQETARKNGFTKETMGCPVVISNEEVEVKSKYISKLKLAKELYEAGGMIVLSHFKGHEMASFGGAIKNLGMGGLTKEGKIIMHRETNTTTLGKALAEAASIFSKKFDKKSLYVNVLLNITRNCDCVGDIGETVSPNIGIMVSDNIVAIERASLDLVQKATKNEFGKMFKTKLDEQILTAVDLGLGKDEYKLEEFQ